MSRVAFLGTGIMGGPMAGRLADAGHPVRAWNRSPDKLAPLAARGVVPSATPAEALRGCDAAIVMLSTGAVIDEVLFAGPTPAISALSPGALVVVMSSVPVATAREQAHIAQAHGLGYVDAPVSGGEPGARNGTLAIFAGGAAADFERARALFAPLGRATHLGPVGSGQLTKLANQVIVGGTLIAIAEALVLARRGGADAAAVREALTGGFGDSQVLRVLGPRMVSGDFVPGSPAQYQLKDMRTAQQFAREAGLQLAQLEAAIGLFEALVERGDGGRDVSVVIREVAARAGAVA